MREFLQRRWFLLSLVVLIAAGQWLGAAAPETAARQVDGLINGRVKSLIVIGILYCMSVTLDGYRIRGALLAPAAILLAVTVNIVLIPLAAPLLMPLQPNPDMAAGLLVAASVPCTLAAASVWTRRAGGNDAVSLLVTLITNAGCFLYTPFWLRLFSTTSADLDVSSMIQKLFVTALLPTAAGQLTRLRGAWAAAADRHKIPLGAAAQVGVLVIVFAAACDGGRRMVLHDGVGPNGHSAPTAAALLIVAGSCIALHVAAMAIGLSGARLLRLERPDAIAVAFAASQKTLPIGVLVATDPQIFGDKYPWAVFPMLIYHASQLFIDTAVADRMHARDAGAAPSEENALA